MGVIQRLRIGAHAATVAATRRAADRLGYDTVWRDHYSPLPDVRNLDEAWWSAPRDTPGVVLDLEAQLRWLHELAPMLKSFRPPRHASTPREYGWENGSYEAVDAHILHAVIRQLRPRRVLELGCGRSTLVTAAACVLNGAEGAPVDFLAADPVAQDFLEPPVQGVTCFLSDGAHQLAAERFTSLEAGDLLFIDTTHTVKLGGEVNRLILNVLPSLAVGVRVHFHDIFLPYEYPREWIEERGYFWTEQYLLQAFLAGNPSWRILCATYALSRAHPHELATLIPEARYVRPSSFWLERVAG